mmetsp:Transcript_3417/g.14092  ORF Transcript_3417/g.14092 Transcript_3417/m.14092 type:complete len:220 (+) Transcript_3417:216-875(+)
MPLPTPPAPTTAAMGPAPQLPRRSVDSSVSQPPPPPPPVLLPPTDPERPLPTLPAASNRSSRRASAMASAGGACSRTLTPNSPSCAASRAQSSTAAATPSPVRQDTCAENAQPSALPTAAASRAVTARCLPPGNPPPAAGGLDAATRRRPPPKPLPKPPPMLPLPGSEAGTSSPSLSASSARLATRPGRLRSAALPADPKVGALGPELLVGEAAVKTAE